MAFLDKYTFSYACNTNGITNLYHYSTSQRCSFILNPKHINIYNTIIALECS